MKLSITDRMVLLEVLQSESIHGNLLTLKLVKDFSDKLGLTQSQLNHIGYKVQDDGRAKYDPNKAHKHFTNIPVPQLVHDVLVRHMNNMNRAEKLTLPMLATSEKFGVKLSDGEAKTYADSVKNGRK